MFWWTLFIWNATGNERLMEASVESTIGVWIWLMTFGSCTCWWKFALVWWHLELHLVSGVCILGKWHLEVTIGATSSNRLWSKSKRDSWIDVNWSSSDFLIRDVICFWISSRSATIMQSKIKIYEGGKFEPGNTEDEETNLRSCSCSNTSTNCCWTAMIR